LYGDAAPKEIDRHHEQSSLRIASDDEAFEVGQGSPSYPHSLAFPQIGIGKDREVTAHESLDRRDFEIRDRFEAFPVFPEHAYEATGLADLQITRLVHAVAQEEIASEERHPGPSSDSAAPRPCLGGR